MRLMARSLTDLPDLQIVPLSSLLLHEQFDETRAYPLVDRLQGDGVLKNPPIVLSAGEHATRYVVLDGANRTTALRLMGLPHVLVQVVHAGDSSVRLETWNHVVTCVDEARLHEALLRHPDLALVPSDAERASFHLSTGSSLAYLALRGGEVQEIVGETRPLSWQMRNLNQLVDALRQVCSLDRTSQLRVQAVEPLYEDFVGLVVYPRFDLEAVVSAAAGGWLFPAGLTRFVISPRALRVNYPLDRLAAPVAQDVKQESLADWLKQAVNRRRVRYYAEATYLFDE
jgi:L-serine kinase (ATP) / ParB family transcriptional regulator, heme-responsive regulator